MRKIITGACVSLVVILIIFLVVTKLELKLASGSFPESVYAEEKSGSTSSGSATSGKLFVGNKLRSYPNRIFSNNNQNHAFGNGTVAANELNCEKWSVVTTIFPPSEAVRRQAHMTGWCLVVVGDRKGPETCQCCISSSFFSQRSLLWFCCYIHISLLIRSLKNILHQNGHWWHYEQHRSVSSFRIIIQNYDDMTATLLIW